MKQDGPYSLRFPLPGPPPEGEGVNRPNGRSIRLSAVTGSHWLEPVEYSLCACGNCDQDDEPCAIADKQLKIYKIFINAVRLE